MRLLALVALTILAGCATAVGDDPGGAEPTQLWDASRGRQIPVALYLPEQRRNCTPAQPCPVAFISPGYGLPHTDYSFLASALVDSGYLVVAIQHDLSTDPPLNKSGDLFANRMPAWKRGADNIRFVRNTFSTTYPGYDWSHLVLIGHSNGGDLSALALQESPSLATTLVTLDNRRYPLPRDHSVNALSIRGSDFEADPGVLPTAQERGASSCIVTIPDSRHNDMNDHGPIELQSKINSLVLQFLKDGRCRA